MQHVYGKEAVKRGPNEWDARACVEGDYSWAEQQPDNDLGKSITPGFRNAIAEGRAFGVPSVRSDIQPIAQRSVADTQNYGDDSSARQVRCFCVFGRLYFVHTRVFCCSPPSHVTSLTNIFNPACIPSGTCLFLSCKGCICQPKAFLHGFLTPTTRFPQISDTW